MEWQQLKGFFYLARLGSFTKAADATFRTQSALSQQIKSLEEELECQLIERIGKRKIKLTLAGERFFEFSKTVLEKYEAITDEISEIKGLEKGRLKIAAPYTTLYNLFPQALKQYIERFPDVEMTILDRPLWMILDLVKNGDIDFGFTLESHVSNDLSMIRWKKVHNVVVTPLGHPLTKVKKIQVRHLLEHPLILPPKTHNRSFRNKLESSFDKANRGYKVIMESSNVELSGIYTELGIGISFATIVPDAPALKGRKLEFLNLDHLFSPDYLAIVMRKDITLSSYKQAFIRMLIGGVSV